MVSAKHRPWQKRVLIPFWVVQLCFLLWIIVSTAIVTQYSRRALGDGFYVVLSFCCAILLLEVSEIILFGAGKLKPLFYLISQVIKTTFWLILFVLDVVSLARRNAAYRRSATTAIGFAILAAILLSFVGTLIYASVIYSRARRGRLDRTRSARPSQDAPYGREIEATPTPLPAPPQETVTETGNGHRHAAVFEMAGSPRTTPPHGLHNGTKTVQ